ncbi:MAG: cytochrome c [Thiohalophilus sp.]|uniref:cytochrome c n=1 Tax=Thiohalophilus sp. TaxID=3028392 RepID=UPI00286FBE41|nr:cytochrome c [Thiohalophilus sp.]MDR9435792.1 cytochrome c [Thiohalophilus sp.]
MNNNKTLSFLSSIVFGFGFFAINGSVHASDGASLFTQHCAQCHQSASRIKTAPEQIAKLLDGKTIRQHRFSLDEATVRAIVNHIKQQKS